MEKFNQTKDPKAQNRNLEDLGTKQKTSEKMSGRLNEAGDPDAEIVPPEAKDNRGWEQPRKVSGNR